MGKRSRKRRPTAIEPSVPVAPAVVPRQARSLLLRVVICLGLVSLVAVSYHSVATHSFIVCDDNEYIYENPVVVQGLTWQGVQWAFNAPHAGNWHPLTWMSHMLDCQWFGKDAGRHHLMSVGIHAASAMLLFLALCMMTRSIWASAAVAALFAVHPLRVESVAWAAERKDVLSAFFWMLTLLAYAWYVQRPGVLRYVLVFVAMALGLMSKSMLVTVPCVLLLLDVWPLGRWSRGSARWLVLEKVPLAALAIADCFAAVHGQKLGNAINSLDALPMGTRIANAAVSYIAYLWQTIWPMNLSIFYPHPGIVNSNLSPTFVAMAFGAGVLLLAVTVGVLWALRSRPYLAVGWFWYLGTLVPVIGILQVGIQARADRYTYVPMIGIYLMVVWAVRELVLAKPRVRPIVIAGTVTAIATCATLTLVQVARWKDSFTLFGYAVELDPEDYFSRNHLGIAYHNEGKIEEAAAQFKEVVRIHPNDDRGNNGLGGCYIRQKQFKLAEFYLKRAVEICPDYAEVHNNLSILYIQQDRLDEALYQGKQAVSLKSDSAGLLLNLGIAYERNRDMANAMNMYQQAMKLDPGNIAVYGRWGLMERERGDRAKAIQLFEQLVRLDPTNVEGHHNLGVIYAENGDEAKGEEHIAEALRLDPNSADAKRNLAILRANRKAKSP